MSLSFSPVAADTFRLRAHRERSDLRQLLSQRFARGRQSSTLGSHNSAYERVRGLMASEKLFDISEEPQSVRDKYGPTQFGEQVLVARRLNLPPSKLRSLHSP